MKKLSFLMTVCCIFIFFQLNGQSTKSVGFAQFPYNQSSCSKENALTIYNYVVQGFDASKRFRVLDRLYGTQVVSDEQELTKDEIFMGGDVLVEKGKLEGAEWMVTGQIMSASSTRNDIENSDGSYTTKYKPDISFFLRIFDVETGEVVASEVITPAGRSLSDEIGNVAAREGFLSNLAGGRGGSSSLPSRDTPEAALNDGMRQLVPHIKSFISDNFPYELEKFEVITDEYGQTRIAAIAPSEMGAELGQLFVVIHRKETTILGETVIAKENKGDLKVDELAGKVVYLVPKLKKDAYLFDYLTENAVDISIMESGDKAGIFSGLNLSADKEKQAQRKAKRENKKTGKNKNE